MVVRQTDRGGWTMEHAIRWIVAAGALLAASSVGPAVADDGARGFLERVYASYAAGGGCEGPEFMHDPAKALGLFTADTVALLERAWAEEGVAAPGFDILIAAQDCDIPAAPSVTVAPTGPDQARGVVAFSNFGQAIEVSHDLVRSAGRWRIHDIRWKSADPDDLPTESLRTLLSQL